MPGPAQLLDYHASISGLYAITLIWNILDFPVTFVPNTTVREDEQFYDEKTSPFLKKEINENMKGTAGLKIGVQVVAPPYREELCLNIAKQVSD